MHLTWILLFLISGPALSHQSSLTSGGKEMFWPDPNIPIYIDAGSSDMAPLQLQSIIESSMDQWNLSSAAKIRSVSSSQNEIKFVSDFPYGNAVLGVTELSYNTKGAIQRSTILLNDDYFFHSSPGTYPAMEVYLGDVVTHEMGHMLGLSHSEVLDSSMFFTSFSGQSSVSFDDITGIRQKYDDSLGRISGYIKGGKEVGIMGTHVQAISRKTGKVSAVISGKDGYFELGGLDLNDTYYLYTSPVKNVSSLPDFFSNIQNKFCPASYVGSFFSRCGRENEGKPQGISLTALNPHRNVGTVTINCSLKTDQQYSSRKLSSTNSYIDLFTYDPAHPEKLEQAFVGWFRDPSLTLWSDPDDFTVDFSRLEMDGYFLKISLVSYPLGTQLEYELDIQNDFQTFVNNKSSLSYSPATETFFTDTEALVPLSSDGARNIFDIRLKSRKLPNSYSAVTFPSFTNFSSATYLPYLLIVSLWEERNGVFEPVVITEPYLSDNASCLDAPFSYAVSEVQNEKAAPLSDQQTAAVPSCGTIEPPDGPGSSMALMTLGFLLTIIASFLGKRSKNFLS